MTNNLKLEFKNNLPDLSKGLDEALSWLTPFNLPPDGSYVTILALEELATNAINLGYTDNQEHLIQVEIIVEKDQLLIQYRDDGVFLIHSMFKNQIPIFPSRIAPQKALASFFSERFQMI